MKIYHLLKKIILKAFILSFFLQLVACGIYKPVDTRKVPVNVNKRVEKNIQEGRGFRVFDSRKKSSGEFEFATSNEMWRATIDLLSFAPFSNVDYSGGIIITDWYNGDNEETNESLKITVRFLSNEIRADGLDIIIHKKICNEVNRCKISKLDTTLSNDIKLAILKDAALMKENEVKENPEAKYKSRETILGTD
jgi:hypothetical protein